MENVLTQIEEYASLLLTVDDIAFLCEVDPAQLRREIRGKTSPMAKAYFKGKYKTMISIRRQTLDMALAGSPQAEQLIIDNLDKQDCNE